MRFFSNRFTSARRSVRATMSKTIRCPRCGAPAVFQRISRLVDRQGRPRALEFEFACTRNAHSIPKRRHGVTRVIRQDRHTFFLG